MAEQPNESAAYVTSGTARLIAVVDEARNQVVIYAQWAAIDRPALEAALPTLVARFGEEAVVEALEAAAGAKEDHHV